MKHITILYGDPDTGKVHICQQAGWELLQGTPQEIQAELEANEQLPEPLTEFGVPLDTAEDQGIYIGPVRAVIHAHAQQYGYRVRYLDTRINP